MPDWDNWDTLSRQFPSSVPRHGEFGQFPVIEGVRYKGLQTAHHNPLCMGFTTFYQFGDIAAKC